MSCIIGITVHFVEIFSIQTRLSIPFQTSVNILTTGLTADFNIGLRLG